MQDVYKNIEEYNPGRKCNVLIVFDDLIVDIISSKKPYQIITEIFIREKKINIATVFITQSYFTVSKDVRINCTHFFILKILYKRELQQIAFNHSSDIDYKDFINFNKICGAKPYSFSD